MAIEIIMPKVDMVMETGTFVEWLKKEGESVQKGEPLFVILTDKAAIEVEAADGGILAGVRAKPDDVIPVTDVIGYLLRPGEILAEPAPAGVSPGPSEPAVMPAPQAEAIHRKPVAQESVPVVTEVGIRATPLARSIAGERKVDLGLVKGSGPRGRIYRADVERYLEAAPPASAGDGKNHLFPEHQLPAIQIGLPDARESRRIPIKGARKIIAERMAYSAQTIPHIHIAIDVDMSEAAHLREKLKAHYQQQYGFGVSYTALIAYTVPRVLAQHPYLNSSLVEDELVLWEDVHLGIATDLDDNLVVPVIRAAQDKKLETIAAEIHQMVERARARKLTPAEMSGGTFTISNLGMYGVVSFTAVINPPETAILAVGKIQERAVPGEGGGNFHPVMTLTLAVDHRAINGAQAARFLGDLKEALENPYLLM